MNVTGAPEVIAQLKRYQAAYPAATGAALMQEGQAIEAASVPLVPVDTGNLRSKHYTSPPVASGKGPEVTVGYGTDYALPVHENMKAKHKVGQAKYLEVPFKAAFAGFSERMVSRIMELIGQGTVSVQQPRSTGQEVRTGKRGGRFVYTRTGSKRYVNR